jgi:hypothetical protein
VFFTVFLGGGVLGWWLTGDTDHLIAGAWFALMVFLIGVGVRFLAPRPRA